MGNKTCNKCSKEGLGWDIPNHTSTGKWKLENHKDPKGEWCIKPTTPIVKMTKTTKNDWYHCDKCENQYGWLLTKEAHDANNAILYCTLEDHIKTHHTLIQ